jgi:hypothetical protein
MQGGVRRNRIGSKNSELWNWEVEDIRKMTGPLAVQEYIQELISSHRVRQGAIPRTLNALSNDLRRPTSTFGSTSTFANSSFS